MSKQLVRQFFKQNKIESKLPSAPALVHFHITMERNPEGSKEIHTMMNRFIFQEQAGRETSASAEQAEIEAAASCEEIVRIMRRKFDPINQPVIIAKAISFEQELVPVLLRMLKTSLNTGFIEIAIRVLAICSLDISDEIIELYDEVREPYTQSLLLVVLGFQGSEDNIPWMITQYHELKRRHPNESFYEGAYYGLSELDSRLYAKAIPHKGK